MPTGLNNSSSFPYGNNKYIYTNPYQASVYPNIYPAGTYIDTDGDGYLNLSPYSVDQENNNLENIFNPFATNKANTNTTTKNQVSSNYSTEIASAVSQISTSEMGIALGLPAGFANFGMIDTSPIMPSLGDFTGLSNYVTMSVTTKISKEIQKVMSAQNYINTHEISPNPNYSYIKGQPPYGQASAEQKKQQEQVLAQLKNEMLTRLDQLLKLLEESANNLTTQNQFAQSFKKTQEGWVKNSIQAKT